MKVNVTHRVEAKDGGKFVTLLAKKNPHNVSDELGKRLIKEGKAAAVVAVQSVPDDTNDVDIDLNAMTVTELRAMAKEMEIVGTGDMNKAALIDAINAASEAASGEGK